MLLIGSMYCWYRSVFDRRNIKKLYLDIIAYKDEEVNHLFHLFRVQEVAPRGLPLRDNLLMTFIRP